MVHLIISIFKGLHFNLLSRLDRDRREFRSNGLKIKSTLNKSKRYAKGQFGVKVCLTGPASNDYHYDFKMITARQLAGGHVRVREILFVLRFVKKNGEYSLVSGEYSPFS